MLDLSENTSLVQVDLNITLLNNLETVNVEGCSNINPSQAVWKRGMSELRAWYGDLLKRGKKILIPVTVIGQSLAGKTSLIRSMQHSKRRLSKRGGVDKLDEATKVFEVSEAEFEEGSKLVFHDFGGQAIYHFAYPLSTRSQFVPLLVINIAEYDRLANLKGADAACKELCFDWLSHLYLSCPGVCQPVVALTHCDGMETAVRKARTKELVTVTEKMRLKMIKKEEDYAPKNSPFFSMVSFCDTSTHLLEKHQDEPWTGYKNTTAGVIFKLKFLLKAVGMPLRDEIPGRLCDVMDAFARINDKAYLPLEDFDLRFPRGRVMLEHLHEIGKVMWYQNIESLKSIVFHRVELLTQVVKLLFDHTGKEVWERRVKEFKVYEHENHKVTEKEYKQMVDDFQQSGVMNSLLLSHVIETESKIDPKTAIEVLKVFHLVCGPIQGTSYIVPYFSPKEITYRWDGSDIPLKLDICFNGLAIPGYVYHLLTAKYVNNLISKDGSVEVVGRNGACGTDKYGSMEYLFHDQVSSTVTLLVLTKPECIADSWRRLLRVSEVLKNHLHEKWKGAHYDIIFFCPHCHLSRKKELRTHVNPDWSTREHQVYNGREVVTCRPEKAVPRPLVVPCEFFTNIVLLLHLSASPYFPSRVLTCSNKK